MGEEVEPMTKIDSKELPVTIFVGLWSGALCSCEIEAKSVTYDKIDPKELPMTK